MRQRFKKAATGGKFAKRSDQHSDCQRIEPEFSAIVEIIGVYELRIDVSHDQAQRQTKDHDGQHGNCQSLCIHNDNVVYSWPPFSTSRYWVESWEFSRLRKLGFDFVRLTVDTAIFLASDSARRSELNRILLDRVRMLHAYGFNVIVDLHPVAQNPAFAPTEIAKNSAVFDQYTTLAAQVARELALLPPDRTVFEPINEPFLPAAELTTWQGMAERLHREIRAVAPDLAVVMTGAMWGHYRALLRLNTDAFRGSNLFYTFHYYEPHTFTHQGVDKELARYVSGLTWPPSEPESAVVARAEAAIAADRKLSAEERAKWSQTTKKLIADYYLTDPSPTKLETDFKSVADWARRNGIANERILVGEFGVTAAGGALPSDRMNWLSAVHTLAEQFNFAWALWAYRGWGGMALADDSAERKLDELVVKALKLTV